MLTFGALYKGNLTFGRAFSSDGLFAEALCALNKQERHTVEYLPEQITVRGRMPNVWNLWLALVLQKSCTSHVFQEHRIASLQSLTFKVVVKLVSV